MPIAAAGSAAAAAVAGALVSRFRREMVLVVIGKSLSVQCRLASLDSVAVLTRRARPAVAAHGLPSACVSQLKLQRGYEPTHPIRTVERRCVVAEPVTAPECRQAQATEPPGERHGEAPLAPAE
jgi:hypothetical protein